jgi:hypothetical protein
VLVALKFGALKVRMIELHVVCSYVTPAYVKRGCVEEGLLAGLTRLLCRTAAPTCVTHNHHYTVYTSLMMSGVSEAVSASVMGTVTRKRYDKPPVTAD